MDGSTKILTVSYGTFSCTLEGFDDPLGAMRDIAEYFRDLSAGDRYFGAEPLTPDPEMLQNIAEREATRRIEARTSDTGVALRQVEKDEEPEADVAEEADVAKEVEPTEEDAGAIAARVVSAAKAVEVAVKENDEPEDSGSGPLTFDDEFLMSDEPEDVLAVDPAVRIDNAGPAETVAEKLRRIRAVVSKNVEPQPPESAVKEASDDAEATLRDRALTETIEAITADLADDEVAPADVDRAPSDDIFPGDDFEEDVDDDDDISARVESAARDTSEALWVKDAPPEAEAQDVPDVPPEAETQDVQDTVEDDASDTVGEAIETDKPVDMDDEEEEADDQRDVKRTVSDIIGNVSDRISGEAEVEADETPEASVETRVVRPQTRPLTPKPEGDVGRLLAETDNKLNEDEVVRRRRVISQMRAAVAATKADRLVSRQVSKEDAEVEEQSPYRADLTEAVGDRPASSTPPLVLVSSQRVDASDMAGRVPAKAQDIPRIEAKDFADFAETMGAKDLPELLEAAAAFTVFSEGQSSFTRPEIMKRVAAVDPTIRLSREESLRSFGQLLRQGKFRKLERGQFTIDQDTRFNPKHRIAGE